MSERFQIESVLGRGGFATVYRAHDRVLGRTVTLKVLDRLGGLSVADRARFVREARILAGLDHPNIVRLHDASVDGRTPFLVLEYVEGEDLRTWLNRTDTLPPFTLGRLIAQSVLQALSYAHVQQVIHRDVKPENVLVISDSVGNVATVKLTDFGLARLIGQTGITQTGHLVGTVGYLAPECVRGQPATVRADLYAVGVLLYELLTGQPPFVGESFEQVLYQQLSSRPRSIRALRPDAPLWLERLVSQLLERDPRHRPVSAATALGLIAGTTEEAPAAQNGVADHRTTALRRTLVSRNPHQEELDEAPPPLPASRPLIARASRTP
ncbi:MAG: serine/threonine protein kinase [Chloroflexi bacterium]|nr:serine/threonine protein kinase [Chloroflexota bacterium]